MLHVAALLKDLSVDEAGFCGAAVAHAPAVGQRHRMCLLQCSLWRMQECKSAQASHLLLVRHSTAPGHAIQRTDRPRVDSTRRTAVTPMAGARLIRRQPSTEQVSDAAACWHLTHSVTWLPNTWLHTCLTGAMCRVAAADSCTMAAAAAAPSSSRSLICMLRALPRVVADALTARIAAASLAAASSASPCASSRPGTWAPSPKCSSRSACACYEDARSVQGLTASASG